MTGNGVGGPYFALNPGSFGILCVPSSGARLHQSASESSHGAVEIGFNSRSNVTNAGSPPSRSSSDDGNASASTGGDNRPRNDVQNRLGGNALCHHRRHRSSVRGLTPKSFCSSAIRFGVGP